MHFICEIGNGDMLRVPARPGRTLMEAVVAARLDGLPAECGGACACATCHVQVASPWLDRLDPPSRAEARMLRFADASGPNSRLACQIVASEALDGLTVRIGA